MGDPHRQPHLIAAELAEAVQSHAEPYLDRLTRDHVELVAAAGRSPSVAQASGLCRVAVLLARHDSPQAARAFVHDRLAALGPRTDPAAQAERDITRAVLDWIPAS